MEGKTRFPSLSSQINTVLSKRSLPDELSNSYYIFERIKYPLSSTEPSKKFFSHKCPLLHHWSELVIIEGRISNTFSLSQICISQISIKFLEEKRENPPHVSRNRGFSRAGKSVDDKEEQRRGKREGLVPRGEAREEIIREGRACIKPCAGSVSSRVSSVGSSFTLKLFKVQGEPWKKIAYVDPYYDPLDDFMQSPPSSNQNLYLPTEIIDFSLLSTLSCFSVPRFKWEKKKNYNA